MAGWKLRKDKAQPGTPDGEPETAAESDTAEQGAQIYGASAVGTETPVEFGLAPAPDMEAGDALRFEDEDGPLKMVDYSAPAFDAARFDEDLLPLSAAPIIASPVEAAATEKPAMTTPSFDTSTEEPGEDVGEFTSTLRMSREELAAAFAPPTPVGIPIVAPFVLDAPLVSQATEETPPRLVVRMGRLSAAFDITKDVTVIGRPDTEMHYYPDVEIDLDDAVSRRHAEIIRRDGAYSIVDTGSTNGTLLNGETLTAHDERPLAHGDRIRVGERTEIIFE